MILLLSLMFHAAWANESCDNSFNTKATYAIQGEGYWMQPAGDRYLTYTETGGTSSRLYDLQQRRNVPMTDDIDGMALPEGDLYVHPDPMRFYKLSDTVSKGTDNKPIYTDRQHEGYYQSLGELKKEGNSRTIRILTAEGHGAIQDYKIRKTGNNYQFRKVYSKPIELCKNLDRENIDFEIPILSRKGNMFATKDQNTGTTKLYSIAVPSGNCTEKADLGVQTDKVSFSFDDSKICYDIQAQSPDGVWRKKLFEYDIRSGKKTAITMDHEDVLYHGYRPDGSLMYTVRKPDSYDSSLLVIDAPKSDLSNSDRRAAESVGYWWAQKCGVTVSSSESAALIGQRLKKSECLSLVSTVRTDSTSHAHTAATANQNVSGTDQDNFKAFCASKNASSQTAAGSQ